MLGHVAVEPGSPVDFAIPGGSISDPDRFDSMNFYAVTANGDPLPQWLSFDATALTFSGTPGASDAGSHEILLIAADTNGAASIGSLTIAVAGDALAPTPESPVPAADKNSIGVASLAASLAPTPAVGAEEMAVPARATPSVVPAEVPLVLDPLPASLLPAPARRAETVVAALTAPPPDEVAPRVGVPVDQLLVV